MILVKNFYHEKISCIIAKIYDLDWKSATSVYYNIAATAKKLIRV